MLFWAVYTVPSGLSDSAKLWYAVGTYTVLMMAYTMNNAPYSALNGVMTSNGSERTSLSQYRFFAAMVAAFIVQGLTLPLVKKFGEGDDAKGWSMTIGIFAVIMVGLFIVTFFSAKERVKPPAGQKPDLKQDFRDVLKNPPWIAMFVMTTFVFITLALRGGSTYYYFTYFVNAEALTAFVDQMGFFANPEAVANPGMGFCILDTFGLIVKPGDSPTAVGFSRFNMAGGLVNIIGVLMAKPLADRFGKKSRVLYWSRRCGDRAIALLLGGCRVSRNDVLADHLHEPALRPDHSAALGDDRGLCRLRGMEVETSFDRLCFCGHCIRLERWPRHRRRLYRLVAHHVWLHP